MSNFRLYLGWLTRAEWLFLAVVTLFWITAIASLPPDLGSIDAYLFRDAACNLLAGQGFQTASFEQSTSFTPVLYSIYTPGSLWVFAGVAKVFGVGTLVARVYPFVLALLADVVFLFCGLRFIVARWQRWLLLCLIALILPFGPLGQIGERPEAVSILLLTLLALSMRLAPKSATAALAGLIGGACFLSEPIAGIIAVLMVGGWVFSTAFYGDSDTTSREIQIGKFVSQSVLAGFMFLLPIAVTAAAFYQSDSHSLERFWHSAASAGLQRQADYTPGDAASAGNQATAVKVPGEHTGVLRRYRDALAFHRTMGPIHLFEMVCFVAIGLLWIILVLKSRGAPGPFFALVLAGIFCFVLPVLLFPLEGSYMTMTKTLFLVLFAANWASIRMSVRSVVIIPLCVLLTGVSVLPAVALGIITRWESRTSYSLALRQADTLRQYLANHPLDGKVVLVPPTHYFLYKEIAGNIYNPAYLSQQENPSQVGAVANCYASTKNFEPGTLPLPEFVAHQNWERLSTSKDSLRVSLLGRQLMSRNWGLECDVYVGPKQ